MLPEGAKLTKLGVSYQPLPVLLELGSRAVSYVKKAKILFFQIGPPMLPPN